MRVVTVKSATGSNPTPYLAKDGDTYQDALNKVGINPSGMTIRAMPSGETITAAQLNNAIPATVTEIYCGTKKLDNEVYSDKRARKAIKESGAKAAVANNLLDGFISGMVNFLGKKALKTAKEKSCNNMAVTELTRGLVTHMKQIARVTVKDSLKPQQQE